MSNDLVKRSVTFTPEQLQAATTGGFVSRLSASIRYVLSGVTPNTWMGPAQPIEPQHQDVMGRQFDYPVGSNLNYKPRASEAIDFPTLRMLADQYDLMRIIIDTRKDQLCKMQWKIVGKDDDDDVEDDPRVKKITEFLQSPDKTHTWQTWLRMLIEDLLVIDAACLYPRPALDGSLFSLDIVDGSTIKIIIDQDGRRPVAPEPAYQQVIKGLPAVDYTADELLYLPRNKRSWKLYGQSPVEQVIMTVNIALRRQVHQLQYYTEGNIPEALINVPEDWKPDQIKQMQSIWDSLLEGNTAQRRHAKFIPGAQKITFTKDMALKDEYDEWLARIVCFAFSISPTPFVKQVNRATAESAQDAAISEGLAPLMTWVQDLINVVITKYFKCDDLKLVFSDEKDLDPRVQAEIHKIYVDAGVLDTDEVRNKIGYAPRAIAAPTPQSTGVVPGDVAAGVSAGNSDDPAAPVLAGTGSPTPSDATPAVQPPGPLPIAGVPAAPPAGGESSVQDTALNGAQVTALLALIDEVASGGLPPATARAVIQAAFPAVKIELIDAMLAGLENFEQPVPPPPVIVAPGQPPAANGKPPVKPGTPAVPGATPPKPGAVADDAAKAAPLINKEIAALTRTLSRTLYKTGKSIAKQAIAGRVEVAKAAPVIATFDFTALYDAEAPLSDAIETVALAGAADGLAKVGSNKARIVNLSNTRAERWAAKRAGELIKSDADGGVLVEATRDLIRGTILNAEVEGWSNSMLKTALEEHYAFSADRAEVIARTELKMANGAGNIIGYRSSGVVKGKEWSTSADDSCEDCAANEAEGEVPLDQDFQSGDDTVPAHPNCNCSVSPVLDDGAGGEADTNDDDQE